MAKVFLNDTYTNEELFEILKKDLKNSDVINIEKQMNSFDIITSWGKFTCSMQENMLKIQQGWNKEKFPFIIILGIAGLLLMFPFLILMVLVYLEYKKGKDLQNQITQILNKYKKQSVK